MLAKSCDDFSNFIFNLLSAIYECLSENPGFTSLPLCIICSKKGS